MREILFRGKRVDNGTWAYGDLLHCDDEMEIDSESLGENGGYIIPETVGQYTGLTDKNGKKVFEADIVKFDGYPEFYSYVCFENFAFMCKSKVYKQYGYHISNESGHKLEVIGNIFDNPELLEGKK